MALKNRDASREMLPMQGHLSSLLFPLLQTALQRSIKGYCWVTWISLHCFTPLLEKKPVASCVCPPLVPSAEALLQTLHHGGCWLRSTSDQNRECASSRPGRSTPQRQRALHNTTLSTVFAQVYHPLAEPCGTSA